MAKKKIYNYKFYPGLGLNDNTYPNAWALLTTNKDFIQKEVAAWILQQVNDNATGFVGYIHTVHQNVKEIQVIILMLGHTTYATQVTKKQQEFQIHIGNKMSHKLMAIE